MLHITIPKQESWDEEKQEFVSLDRECHLQLEHSLVSLSKWEAKWQKPFLTKQEKSFEESVEAITNIVKSLVLLIGAIIVLSLVPEEKLNAAMGVVMILASIIAAFALIAILISKSSPEFAKSALDMAAFGSLIKSIGIAVLLIAAAIKIIGKLNPDQANRGFTGMAVCVAAMFGIMCLLMVYSKRS